MADDADIAQARMEQEEEFRRAARAHRKIFTPEDSSDTCMICGEEIPSERQIAVPGCQCCVRCANREERRAQR